MSTNPIPAGFTLTILPTVPPRPSDLILTMTKGTRTRTNRGGGGKIPTRI